MEKVINIKNVIISLTMIFLMILPTISAKELELISDKYILYNLNDNKVLMKKEENTRTQIASLTKLMTVLVATENIKDYDKKVTITSEMIDNIEWDVAKIGLKKGQVVTYNDLLFCTMLPSAADCANGLAISIGGSIDKFVEMMNSKANELGLKNTHFENPVGLYSKENYSTAYDVAELLKYSLKSKKFKEVFEKKEYILTTGKKVKSTLKSYNEKIGEDISYITGAKTGFIDEAGRCLASTATIDNVNYLLVTLNAYTSKKSPHILDATATYKYFSTNYSYKNILDKNDTIVKLKTKYAKEKEIGIHHDEEFTSYLKNDFKKEDLVYDYDGIKEISYFTKKGTKLGTVKIKYKNEVLKEFTINYNETLSFSIWQFIWENKFYAIAAIIILYLFALISKKNRRRKRRKHRITR